MVLKTDIERVVRALARALPRGTHQSAKRPTDGQEAEAVTKLSLRPEQTGDDAERRSIRIPRELAQDLEQYRLALGAGTTLNYVIIEGLREFLRRDKGFQAVRAGVVAGGDQPGGAA